MTKKEASANAGAFFLCGQQNGACPKGRKGQAPQAGSRAMVYYMGEYTRKCDFCQVSQN